MSEYWDIYDKNRVFQNRAIQRGEPFADGEYYICCEVWITNARGEFLITQRHPGKKAGGLWEFTGGGVLSGETSLQGAVREVREELGIPLDESDLRLLTTYRSRNYFMDIFRVHKDLSVSDLVLQEEEVVDAKWVAQNELCAMIEDRQVVRSVAERFALCRAML